MKMFIWILSVVCCLFFGFIAFDEPAGIKTPAVFQSDENISFKWAFGAIAGSGKDRMFVSVTRDTVLKTGDEIKMLVELTKDCFVYLIHQSSKGEISLLFPYELRQFMGDYKVGKNYYVPKGRKWFELDNNTGRESFHVLAASERLVELEALLGNYQSADDSKKAELAKEVVAEIRNVKKRFKTFTTLAEKPITIGGNVRGMAKVEEAKRPDVADFATQISATNFYSKTFTIDHR